MCNRSVKIMFAGYYQISMTIGCKSHSVCMCYFMRNGMEGKHEDVSAVYRRVTVYNGYDTVHTSALTYYKVGDIVTVSMYDGTEVYSNENLVTGFVGIKIGEK